MSTGANEIVEDPFAHPALFYRGTQEYLAGTVPFIQEGLSKGEPVAVAVPMANLELLRAELGDAADRVRLMDMTEAGRNPGRIIPGVLRAFADAHPGTRVRIIGEPIWPGRSTAEYPACAQHEALINRAFAGRDATILCPYDEERLAPGVLADAEANHPVLIDRDGPRRSEWFAPDRIAAVYNQPLPRPPRAATFTFDLASLAEARRFVVAEARRLGLSGERVENLALAVNELATNSIVHGGGSGTLGVWTEDGHLVCEVRDAGHITDPLAGRTAVAPDRAGGRGLLMANYLVDLLRGHTTPEGTTLQLHLALNNR